MIAVLSLLVVLVLSILVTRVATVALTLTGLSRQSARFQARSAFTGVGFTTSEAERVVNHPVRRRILMILMLLGNAGIVTVVSSLIITFVRASEGGGSWTARIVFLVGGLVVLMWLAQSKWLDRHLSRLIGKALERWTDLDTRDYSSLLQLGGDYRIVELNVEPSDWMANRTLKELQLKQEGILVLGIQRPGGLYYGAPRGETRLETGETLLLYGRTESVQNLDARRRGPGGSIAHSEAVAKQREVEQAAEHDERAES